MAKVIKVTGEKSPITGTHYLYTATLESNATEEDKKKVRWQLYLKDETGNWIKHPKSPERKENKSGAIQDYAFGELFTNQELMLTAFNEKAVLSEPPALKITPIAGNPKITKFFFTDLTGKTLEEIFYNQRMMLQIHTIGMLGKKIDYSIYNEANGTKTEVRKDQTKEIIKPNGVVNPEESFMIDMPIRTGQSTSAEEHHFKIKIWETGNETNFLEQDLKIKNQTINQMSDPETQVPVKTGTSEPVKKEEDKKEEKCYCEKEFSVADIKAFYKSKKLFSASNCPLPANMKTYEEFTKALNKAMKDYDLNTCLRKAHFLAQIEVESDRLNTTMEYATGWDYDHTTHYENYNKYLLFKRDPKSHKAYGTAKIKRDYNRYLECLKHGHKVKGYGPKYKGKGLLQLTWKDTYEDYFKYIETKSPELKEKKYIENPEIIAKNLFYSCDASTWYWRYQSKWGDLNTAADRDDVYYINIGVNGGFNHFKERIDNVKSILELMVVKEKCKNYKIKKELGKYTFLTSKMKDTQYGKDHKKAFEKYDD